MEPIDIDVSCATCGYNLRGLQITHRCPECGTRIGRSICAISERELRWTHMRRRAVEALMGARAPLILGALGLVMLTVWHGRLQSFVELGLLHTIAIDVVGGIFASFVVQRMLALPADWLADLAFDCVALFLFSTGVAALVPVLQVTAIQLWLPAALISWRLDLEAADFLPFAALLVFARIIGALPVLLSA